MPATAAWSSAFKARCSSAANRRSCTSGGCACPRGGGAANKAQLMVLTSLLLADEVFDLRDTMSQAANVNTQLPQQEVIYQGLTPQDEQEITSAIGRLAARVEKLTARIQKA